MVDRKRLTAVKSQVRDVMEGAYTPAEGLESGYILTPTGLRISRTRIMGTVMAKFLSEDGQYGFIVIDDETETIRVKFFKDLKPMQDIEVGHIIDLIGKIREYNGERYIQPEILRRIEDPNFLALRLAELAHQKKRLSAAREKVEALMKRTSDLGELKKLAEAEGIDSDSVEAIATAREPSLPDSRGVVLDTITRVDDGTGAEYVKIIAESKLPENQVEETINSLLSEGTCYEPRPGRIKRL